MKTQNLGWFIALPFLAVFFGLACAVLPWFLSLGLGLLIGLLLVFGRFTLLDVFVLMALVLGIVPITGRSKVDALAMVIMVFLLLKNARHVRPVIQRHKQVLLGVGLIAAWGGVAVAYGATYRHNDLQLIYGDARFLLYWLSLPLTLVLLQQRLTVKKLVIMLAVLGAALGLIGVLQSLLHRPLLLSESGRVEALQNTMTTYQDVTRSIVPGTIIVSFAFYFSLARLMSAEKASKWWWIVLALSVGGILVNFGRTLWLASILISLFMIFRVASGKSFRLLAGLAALGIAGAVALAFAKPVLIESIVNRVASSSEEGRSSTSWSWRQFENRFAIASIKSRPILGVGLGGEYKPFEPAMRTFQEQTTYIHNAYLFLPMKFGIFGAACILGVLFWLCFRINRKMPEGRGTHLERDATMACGAIMLQVMFLSFIEPEFNSFVGTMVIATLIGVAEHVRASGAQEEPAVMPGRSFSTRYRPPYGAQKLKV